MPDLPSGGETWIRLAKWVSLWIEASVMESAGFDYVLILSHTHHGKWIANGLSVAGL